MSGKATAHLWLCSFYGAIVRVLDVLNLSFKLRYPGSHVSVVSFALDEFVVKDDQQVAENEKHHNLDNPAQDPFKPLSMAIGPASGVRRSALKYHGGHLYVFVLRGSVSPFAKVLK